MLVNRGVKYIYSQEIEYNSFIMYATKLILYGVQSVGSYIQTMIS